MNCIFKRVVTFMLVPGAVGMSGCGSTRWATERPQVTSACAGWNKIRIKPETALYLARNDFAAGIDIDAHNLNGQNNGCWK